MGTEAAEGKPGAVAVCKDGQLFVLIWARKASMSTLPAATSDNREGFGSAWAGTVCFWGWRTVISSWVMRKDGGTWFFLFLSGIGDGRDILCGQKSQLVSVAGLQAQAVRVLCADDRGRHKEGACNVGVPGGIAHAYIVGSRLPADKRRFLHHRKKAGPAVS